jgi:hypothetical protein
VTAPSAAPSSSHADSDDIGLRGIGETGVMPATAPARLVGPLPSGSATREDRQQALLAVLSGENHSGSLPQVISAPGLDFDRKLRDRLTRAEINAKGTSSARLLSIRTTGPTVTGALPPSAVQRALMAQIGRVRRCYEDGLRNNPALQGRVVFGFVIEGDGSPKGVADKVNELHDVDVVVCVERVLRALSFPSAGAATTVSYPFSFSPGD